MTQIPAGKINPGAAIDYVWHGNGWAIAANCLGIEYFTCETVSPTGGAKVGNVQCLNKDGELGEVMISVHVIKLPMPPLPANFME
ncbi:MAG: hypothetical protein R3E08_05850 [Thiotrichaceae bacterium]